MPMSKAVTVEKTSKLSFRHLENWESNSERKLAKIRTIWLWLLAVSPVPGGSWSSSPILLDSSDFWEVEIWWNMKIENISRGLKKRTFGEFEMNNDVLAFEPVPSGKSHRYLLEITSRGSIFFTHPPGLWLVFEGLLGVLSCCLDIVHCMLHVILYPVNHLTLNIEPGYHKHFNYRWNVWWFVILEQAKNVASELYSEILLYWSNQIYVIIKNCIHARNTRINKKWNL